MDKCIAIKEWRSTGVSKYGILWTRTMCAVRHNKSGTVRHQPSRASHLGLAPFSLCVFIQTSAAVCPASFRRSRCASFSKSRVAVSSLNLSPAIRWRCEEERFQPDQKHVVPICRAATWGQSLASRANSRALAVRRRSWNFKLQTNYPDLYHQRF